MFEKEIKFIADYSLNNLKKLGQSFAFERLLSAELHPAVIQYLNAELDYLLYEDRKKLLSKSIFDYSGTAAAKYFKLMGEEIKRTKRVSYDDIKKIVVQAVSFNINYTVRPKWSLMKLIYSDAESRPAGDIKQMLDSVYYYDYLRKVITAYLNKKNVQNISSVEFEAILTKIDNELFSTRKEELVENALYSIAGFHNEGGTGKSKIYPQAVEVFLKEKDLIDYLFKLRRTLPPELKQKYEVEEILKILFHEKKSAGREDLKLQGSKYKYTSPEVEGSRETDINTEDKKTGQDDVINSENVNNDESLQNDDRKAIIELEDDRDEAGYTKDSAADDNTDDELSKPMDEEEDLLAYYDSQLKSLEEEADSISSELQELATRDIDSSTDAGEDSFKEEEAEELPEEIEDEDFEIEIEDDDISGEIDFSEEQKLEDGTGIGKSSYTGKDFDKDLFTFLSDREIDKVVSSVFNEDRDDFTSVMEKISECGSYKEAAEILKGVFSSYQINPYSKDAVTLTNAVSNYFNQD